MQINLSIYSIILFNKYYSIKLNKNKKYLVILFNV